MTPCCSSRSIRRLTAGADRPPWRPCRESVRRASLRRSATISRSDASSCQAVGHGKDYWICQSTQESCAFSCVDPRSVAWIAAGASIAEPMSTRVAASGQARVGRCRRSRCSRPSSGACCGCAVSMVHHANKVRENPSGVKVGGHQASSASMVSIMSALYFEHLRGARPRVGEAARGAGAARDQLPARAGSIGAT